MFYERLNQLCKQHGTTVTEVACTHLGVASSAATNWKKGASPRADIVIRAAQHFGVTADYLLGLTDSPVPTGAAQALGSEVLTAAARLQAASPQARAAALAAMQAVLDSLGRPGD